MNTVKKSVKLKKLEFFEGHLLPRQDHLGSELMGVCGDHLNSPSHSKCPRPEFDNRSGLQTSSFRGLTLKRPNFEEGIRYTREVPFEHGSARRSSRLARENRCLRHFSASALFNNE